MIKGIMVERLIAPAMMHLIGLFIPHYAEKANLDGTK
jgi:hypothetical protein